MSGCVLRLPGSVLARVRREDGHTTLELRPAFIIKSEQMPGVDPGTLWTQDVDLIFREASWRANQLVPDGMEIIGGNITLNGITHLDLLPMPLNLPGNIELEIKGEAGDFAVAGEHFDLRALGVGKYTHHE